MARPYKHALDDLITIAEETAEIMWRSYDAFLSGPRPPGWKEKAWEIFQRCMACDTRLWRLKEIRERQHGRPASGSEGERGAEL